MSRKQREFLPLKYSITVYDIILSKWKKSKDHEQKHIFTKNSPI